ncbi:MAG: dTMP kinase [Acidimicrobiia bacterium]
MTNPPDASRYISFEGVEGAGKSTVASRLVAHLTSVGETAVRVREPGGTAVGEAVREIVLGDGHHPSPRAEAALFAAARAELVAEIVRPALEGGAWVVSDRSVYSSLAYQAGGRGLDLDEVRTLNDIAIGGLWPGRVVLLRLDHQEGLARQSVGDRIGDEPDGFHRAVSTTFDALAEAESDRFTIVDAAKPLRQVVETVIGLLGLPS